MRSKYRNKKTVVDGITFDSMAEAARYRTLKVKLDAGEIKDLTLQKRFPVVINGVKVCTYVADFVYTHRLGGQVVEDVKGFITPMYRLKKKLVNAVHGVEIQEITKAGAK
jgi:hypothetical protein